MSEQEPIERDRKADIACLLTPLNRIAASLEAIQQSLLVFERFYTSPFILADGKLTLFEPDGKTVWREFPPPRLSSGSR
jgi:hypothetical protein